jgi:hypothetical protein
MTFRRGCLAAVVLMVAMMTGPGVAQLEDNLLATSEENLEGYMAPLRTGLSGTMNSAIFRSGHVPKSGLTFRIGVATMAVGFDDEDEVYLPNDPVGFTAQEPTDVPTVAGDPAGAHVEGESGLVQYYPGGFDLTGFQLGVPQVSIGGIMGTRLVGRYIAIDIGDADIGEFKYLGFGAQHSLTQYMGTPPVDVAVGVFFQDFEIGSDLVAAKALHFDVTGSKSFGILQPYIGLGYDSMELDIKVEDEDDPEDSLDLTLDKETNFHFTAGAQLSLAFIHAFFEFNAAAGNGFALGVELGK